MQKMGDLVEEAAYAINSDYKVVAEAMEKLVESTKKVEELVDKRKKNDEVLLEARECKDYLVHLLNLRHVPTILGAPGHKGGRERGYFGGLTISIARTLGFMV